VAIEAGGSIIACGQVKQHADGSRELASLVVREHWRGQGIGSAIVRELVAGAEPPLWLMCRCELIPYYQRFGFRRVRPEEALPAYFRWIRRLMKLLSWVLPAARRGAIMVHGGGESE
jgi:predicted N-acetyltransferase YhbS